MSKKYKNYAELFAAFESGELDKDKFMFMVDNDDVSLSYLGDDLDEEEAYEYARSLFSSGSDYGDVIEILNTIGYKAEGV